MRGYPTTLDLRWRVRVMSTSGCGGDSNGSYGGVQSSGGGRSGDADVDVADGVAVAGELVEHRERGGALLADLLEAPEPDLPRRGARAPGRGAELEHALPVAKHQGGGLGPQRVGQRRERGGGRPRREVLTPARHAVRPDDGREAGGRIGLVLEHPAGDVHHRDGPERAGK